MEKQNNATVGAWVDFLSRISKVYVNRLENTFGTNVSELPALEFKFDSGALKTEDEIALHEIVINLRDLFKVFADAMPSLHIDQESAVVQTQYGSLDLFYTGEDDSREKLDWIIQEHLRTHDDLIDAFPENTYGFIVSESMNGNDSSSIYYPSPDLYFRCPENISEENWRKACEIFNVIFDLSRYAAMYQLSASRKVDDNKLEELNEFYGLKKLA